MTHEILTQISAHPRHVAAALTIPFELAGGGCAYVYSKLSKKPLQELKAILWKFSVGLAGLFFGVSGVICIGIVTQWWYLLILLTMPEVLIMLYALCRSSASDLKRMADDCSET